VEAMTGGLTGAEVFVPLHDPELPERLKLIAVDLDLVFFDPRAEIANCLPLFQECR
jgi:hypothetical protein